MPPQRTSASPNPSLTADQERVASYGDRGTLCLYGPPGTGKTTALQAYLARRLAAGERPDRFLVLLPQRAHVRRYEEALVERLAAYDAPVRGGVDLVTFPGFCQRQIALFWPLVAAEAGFLRPDEEPVFLTIETTQYYMWRIVEPLITERGYFSDVAVRRGRLLSQLIDNLNKSALVGFDHREIEPRLRAAWTGTPDRLASYRQAQECATLFRAYCLEHNLLDFSLVCEMFSQRLLPHPAFAAAFSERYHTLVADNLEENVPVAHDLVEWAMERCAATLLAIDEGAGYRVFLGADHDGARALARRCTEAVHLARPLLSEGAPLAFAARVCAAFEAPDAPCSDGDAPDGDGHDAVAHYGGGTLWIGMIRWIVERVGELVSSGVSPGEIAIVAPYVSEVMRFALEDALARAPEPLRLHALRPALPMREEPALAGMLTVARLAHPAWRITIQGQDFPLTREDVALALEQTLAGLDPIRAQHLAAQAFDAHAYREGAGGLVALTRLQDGHPRAAQIGRMWERVGYRFQEPYAALYDWLAAYQSGAPTTLDLFYSRLFGDLLSRPGFALHANPLGARTYGRLVESANKFVQAVGDDESSGGDGERANALGRDYITLLLGGIATAEYLTDTPEPGDDAVILAPAYAYLTRDLHTEYQIWADLASPGWWNRPNQPLTHPYVLSRSWPEGRLWQDSDEDRARRRALGGVLAGLAARCGRRLLLASSQLGIGGEEQTGELERAILVAQTR